MHKWPKLLKKLPTKLSTKLPANLPTKLLAKLLARSPQERQILLRAVLWLSLIRLGLWLLPFRTLLRWLNSPPAVRSTDAASISSIVGSIVWAVETSSRYWPGEVKCLARALTTKVLLNRQGHDPALHIGVAKGEAGQLEAHAWLEYHGQIIMGQLPDLPRYVRLPSLEGAIG